MKKLSSFLLVTLFFNIEIIAMDQKILLPREFAISGNQALISNKILSYVKDKIIQINKMKKKLVVTTTRREKYTGDILVNVSGPVGLDKVSM